MTRPANQEVCCANWRSMPMRARPMICPTGVTGRMEAKRLWIQSVRGTGEKTRLRSVGTLQIWTVPTLLNLVFSPVPRTDWIHNLFASILPVTPVGQIIGLALIGMLLQFAQHTSWFAGRVMINNRLKYNGLARVRFDLYTKLQ